MVLFGGGMCGGFIWGGRAWGVLFGGHVWFYWGGMVLLGGACMVFSDTMRYGQ